MPAEQPDNLYKWRFLLLCICLAAGSVPRFMALDTIPGLEHDEALICLGATEIAEQNTYPLTGDKVYEGPLLEYIIAFFIKIFGASALTARHVMAGGGLLAVIFIYWAGSVWGGWKTGLYSAMLMMFSAWHLAASRVIYACNFSQVFIPLWIACIGLYYKSHKIYHLLLAGLALGLAANGRFTSYFLALPTILMVLIYQKKHKWTHLALFLVIGVLPSAPVLLYNINHSWPAFSILKGPGQEHLLHRGSQLVPRITAFILSAFNALTGKKFWLDIECISPFPNLILPMLALSGGLAIFLLPKVKYPGSKWLIYVLVGLLIVIPLITKTSGTYHKGYHPHYLDLVMPFLLLACGFALTAIDVWRARLGTLVALIAVLLQAFMVFGHIAPHICKEGLPGRWSGRSTRLAHCIEHNFDPDQTTVVIPWRFGAGYPEITFLLRDFTVKPILDAFKGFETTNAKTIQARVVHVSPNWKLPEPPWSVLTCSNDQNLKLYYIDSPGFYIDGTWQSNNGYHLQIRSSEQDDPGQELIVSDGIKEMRLTVTKRNNLTCHNPLLMATNVQVAPRHEKLFRSFEEDIFAHQLIAESSDSEQWTFIWPAVGYLSGAASVIHNGRVREGAWSGAAIFY